MSSDIDWRTKLRQDIREAIPDSSKEFVWMLGTCKNEAPLLYLFLKHHREIGIDRFIIVDDNSDDGSREILESAPDVVRIEIDARFPEYKGEFRSIICDEILADRWVAFLDIDELLVLPGGKSSKLKNYCRNLERAGLNASIGMMVDVYSPQQPPNSELGSASSRWFFDSNSYWATRVLNRSREKWPTPDFNIFGGASDRVYFNSPVNGDFLERMFAKISLNRVGVPRRSSFGMMLDRYLSRRLRKFEKSDNITSPKQHKIAMLKWEQGTTFMSSPHRVSKSYRYSAERVCLLHRKFLGDYEARFRVLAGAAQHANNSEIYRHYSEHFRRYGSSRRRLMFSGSREYRSWRDLERSGLFGPRIRLLRVMRICRSIAAAFGPTKRVKRWARDENSWPHRILRRYQP